MSQVKFFVASIAPVFHGDRICLKVQGGGFALQEIEEDGIVLLGKGEYVPLSEVEHVLTEIYKEQKLRRPKKPRIKKAPVVSLRGAL